MIYVDEELMVCALASLKKPGARWFTFCHLERGQMLDHKMHDNYDVRRPQHARELPAIRWTCTFEVLRHLVTIKNPKAAALYPPGKDVPAWP